MNILLIHQFYLPAGAAGGSRWNDTSRYWAAQEHTITVIAGMVDYATGQKYAHCQGKFRIEEQPAPGIRVVRTHISARYNRGWWGRLWAYFTFMVSGIWAGMIQVYNAPVDVVIVTSPPLLIGIVGVWLAHWRRVPLVFEIRDLWPDAPVQLGILTNPFLVRLAYWLEAWLYRQAQHIVVLTEGYRDVLIQQKNVACNRISVIPNAADFELSDTIACTFNRNGFRQQQGMENGFWVVYAGAHGIVNRLDTVLEAAEKLVDTPVQFLLIGDGPEKKALQKEAVRRGLSNVRFMERMPKRAVIPFLLAADAGLTTAPRLPIFRRVLTNKLFDYFSCRLPVLTMLDGDSRRLVETAEAGVYVEPENAGALRRAILDYLRQPELVRQQGENGYTYAQRHFNRRTLAQHYLTVINAVSTGW